MGDKRSSSFDRDKSDEERRLAAIAKSQAINSQPTGGQEPQDQSVDANNITNTPQGVDAATAAAMAQIAAGEKQRREQQTAEELQQTMQNIQQKVGGLPTSGVSSTEGANGTVGGTNDAGGVENGAGGGSGELYTKALEEQQKIEEKATQDAIDANKANDLEYRNFLGNLVQSYQNNLNEAKKEAELQKQIDTNKSVFAGVTEFASTLVNLLGTTQGAVNQQPKTYTQDWMREADQHRQQERERLDRMRDKLRDQEIKGENARYQMTKEQIAEELKLQQLKRKNALERVQAKEEAKQNAWKRGITDKELKLKEEAQAADIEQGRQRTAQNWAQINNSKEQFEIQQRERGWVRDEKADGGWRYDPATAGVVSRKGDSTTPLVLMDEDGNISVANLTKEQKSEVFDSAYNAIKSELGEKEAAEFDKKYRMAMDDDAKGQLLREYMGRSKKMEEIINRLDSNYRARNGYASNNFGNRTDKPAPSGPVAPVYRKDYSTADLISNL